MKNYTNAQALKEIRLIAKNNGLVFKKQNATINTMQAYRFTNRKTGLTVASNFTFWSAYENCVSGYIDSINQNKKGE